MVPSEIQKRTIRLGKAFVKQLSSDPTADIFSRWIAFYIAEQMTIAKKAKGKNKAEAEQKCFEAILKLWEHRSHLPVGVRPFKNFDSIFRALERLDPENSTPYFYSHPHSSDKDNSDEIADGVQEWIDIARGIDQAARVWLEYIFQQAALSAADEETISWLVNSVGSSKLEDTSIVFRLIGLGNESDSEGIAEEEKKAQQEKLQFRIKQLDAFNEFNQNLRSILIAELSAVTNDNSSANTMDKDSKL